MRRGSWIDAVSKVSGWAFALILLVVVVGLLYRGCVGLGSMYLKDVRKAQSQTVEAK